MSRVVTISLAFLALASCSPGSTGPTGSITSGPSRADAATEAACRQRADQVYDRQNRGEIYSPQSGVNSPSSAFYAPGDDSRSLGRIFARDRMIRECVRNTGTGADRGGVAPTGAPTEGSGKY